MERTHFAGLLLRGPAGGGVRLLGLHVVGHEAGGLGLGQHAAAGKRVRWNDKRPGDLLFYDGNDDGRVDHVDTFIGGDWAIDSGGGNAGVTITWVSGNWYEDHFVRARRVIG